MPQKLVYFKPFIISGKISLNHVVCSNIAEGNDENEKFNDG